MSSTELRSNDLLFRNPLSEEIRPLARLLNTLNNRCLPVLNTLKKKKESATSSHVMDVFTVDRFLLFQTSLFFFKLTVIYSFATFYVPKVKEIFNVVLNLSITKRRTIRMTS